MATFKNFKLPPLFWPGLATIDFFIDKIFIDFRNSLFYQFVGITYSLISFMIFFVALVALSARSADVDDPISASTFHVRVRAPRSNTISASRTSNDTCYNAYARFSILSGGSVGTEGESKLKGPSSLHPSFGVSRLVCRITRQHTALHYICFFFQLRNTYYNTPHLLIDSMCTMPRRRFCCAARFKPTNIATATAACNRNRNCTDVRSFIPSHLQLLKHHPLPQ